MFFKYVGWVEDLLASGCMPLVQCFLDNKATATIQYKYTAQQNQAFEFRCADWQGPASHKDSHVCEINTWMWNLPGPSLELDGFQSEKQKGSGDSPGLKD
jgi:hypothetical protein